jgi:hypothetical protein
MSNVGIFFIIIKLEPGLGPCEGIDVVGQTFFDEPFKGFFGGVVCSFASLLETRLE